MKYSKAKFKLYIVIGPSCAGKSTFVTQLKSRITSLRHFDEAVLFHSLFKLEKGLKSEIVRYPERSINEILDSNIHRFSFCPSLKEMYYDKLSRAKSNFGLASKANEDGSYKIIKPILWIQGVSLLVSNITDNNGTLAIEFARGMNQLDTNVYAQNIDNIIARFQPIHMKGQVLIVYINAPFAKRIERNRQRHKTGGHFVPEKTMYSIYRKDDFANLIVSKSAIKTEKYTIPFVSLYNNESTLERTKDYFLSAIDSIIAGSSPE